MPSLTAHCLCGEISMIGDYDHLRKIIDENKSAFFIGCQGPDLLMYYHICPWQSQKGAKEVRNIADKIHEQKINIFFENLLNEVIKREKDTLIAYTAGFLCHHSLDSIAHPYIYYFTDSTKEDIGYSHQIFENQIDLGILQLYKLTMREYRPDKKIKNFKKGKEEVLEALREVIYATYGEIVSNKQLNDCFKDMDKVVSILTDVDGKRYYLVEFLENLFNLKGKGTSMVVPQKYDNKLDAMNYRREKWYYPSDSSISSNDDFQMLFLKAINQTRAEFSLLEKMIMKEDHIKDILEIIGDRSFCSGLSTDKKMYYFYKDNEKRDN